MTRAGRKQCQRKKSLFSEKIVHNDDARKYKNFMKSFEINFEKIPHGHGLSFKKGISDGLLDVQNKEPDVPKTHLASYRNGFDLGECLKKIVASQVN